MGRCGKIENRCGVLDQGRPPDKRLARGRAEQLAGDDESEHLSLTYIIYFIYITILAIRIVYYISLDVTYLSTFNSNVMYYKEPLSICTEIALYKSSL